jgi:glycosyltransferase involved in cell wall biosynthesis/LmbE family N-acetylglucosaminyl deacetylase
MKILMVTRERADDRRYGLGKTLTPIVEELRTRTVEVGYLSQEDVGARAGNAMMRLSGLAETACRRGLIEEPTAALLLAIAERLNMGRLACKIAHRDGYTHVHCHDPIIAHGLRLFGLGRRRRFVWGVTQHGFGSYTQALHDDGAPLKVRRMRLLRRLELSILRRAEWVICPNERSLAALARDLAAYPIPSHWRAIPHSRPPEFLSDRASARKALGWDDAAFYIIGVGRLAPLKQFDVLIRAFAEVNHQDVRLVIIGGGDASRLRRVATQLQVEDRVSFAVTDTMSPYYAGADLYVSTSATESFGLANLEALCAGVPSICTSVGAVPDVMGAATYLVPPGDVRTLASAMRELIDSPALRSRIVRRGLARAACWPSPAAVAESYVRAYEGAPHIDLHQDCRDEARHFSAARLWRPIIDRLPICPLPGLLPLPVGQKVLVFAPHPDDEVLACGGTLALLQDSGCQVRVIIMTDGSQGDPSHHFEGDISARRYCESRTALEKLGITDVEFYGEPDGGLSSGSETVAKIRRSIDAFGPDLLFLPPLLDHHRDHVAGSLAVLEAWHESGTLARAFMWELWQPLPVNCVTDITSVFDRRQRAANCYSTALKYCNYPRATGGLAAYRALYLAQGNYAEGFLELDPHSVWSDVDNLLGLRAGEEVSRARLAS